MKRTKLFIILSLIISAVTLSLLTIKPVVKAKEITQDLKAGESFEEPDRISVSDLKSGGKSIGNKLVLDKHKTLTYDKSATYGSLVFEFVSKTTNWSEDGDGAQIHFFSTWQMNGMFWLRPDHLRIAYKIEGKDTSNYIVGDPISNGTHTIEIGRLAIMNGDEYSGIQYYYMKVDGEFWISYRSDDYENTISNTKEEYNSNSLFFTGTVGNVMLDKDWKGSHVTYMVNGTVVDDFMCTDDYLTKPATDPVVEGKTFVGWFDNMGKEWDFKNNQVTDNLILRAGFKGEYSVSDEVYFSDSNYTPILRFLVASDVHIATNPSVRDSNLASTITWAYEIAESNSKYKKLDATLFAGDISDNGDVGNLQTFNDIAKQYLRSDTQFIVSMGNHDFRMASADDSISQFANIFGPVDKHLVINGFHFITLSPDLSEGEHFSESKVEWLDEQLQIAQEADPTKPIFVMQHEHIQGTVYGSDAWYVSELTDVLCKYPQVVDFSGHSHYPLSDPRSIWQGTFTALGTGTMHYYEVGINGYKVTGVFPNDRQGGWSISPHANSAASEFQIIEIDANNAIRVTAYDLASRTVIAQYYIRNAMDDVKFTYSHDERAKDSDLPEFEANQNLELTNVKTKVTLKFRQATCDDIIESYRVKVYQGTELIKTEYILSDYFFHPTPEYIEYTIEGLRSETEYRFEVYAVNVWNVESTSHLSGTITTEYVDYGEEGFGAFDLINVLDIDIPDNNGVLTNIPSESKVYNYPGTSPSYTAVFQYYLITGDLNNKDEFRTQVGTNWEYYTCFWIQTGKFDTVFCGWIYSTKPSDRIKYNIESNKVYKIEYGTIYVSSGEHEGEGLVYLKINDEEVRSFYIPFNEFKSTKYNVSMHISDNYAIADLSLGRTVEYYVDDQKIASKFAISGMTTTPPTAPSKPGLYFVGWYTDPVGGSRVEFDEPIYSDDEVIKLYARYTDTTYDVNFYHEDGTLIETQAVGKDCTVKKPVDPVKTGEYKYSFIKWVIKGTDTEFDFNTRLNEAIDLEAVFEEYRYKIVYLVDGLEYITKYYVESNPSVIIGGEPSVPTIAHTTGYWKYSGDRTNKDIYASARYDGIATTPTTQIKLNKFEGATVDIADDLTRFYLSFADTDEQANWIFTYPVSGGHERQNITFSWTDSQRNTLYYVYFADNSEFKNAFIIKTDSKSVDYVGIFTPGKTYYWKVVGVSTGAISEVDTFTVLDTPVRWISAGSVFNVRDAGGWTTTDSKMVKYGMLYRGGQLSIDQSGEVSYMNDYSFKVFDYLDMKTEIELRGDHPHDFAQFNELAQEINIAADNYMGIFNISDARKTQYREAFELLADESNYPFYFHCSWGADRTGTFAFLVNGMLGVPFEQLVEDYELTSFSNSGTRTRLGWSNGAFMQMYNKFMSDYRKNDTDTLKDAVTNYLLTYIGVSQETINSIRGLLLEEKTSTLVTHTVTYMVDGEVYQRALIFDGGLIQEIAPRYLEKNLDCYMLNGERFDPNTKVTSDLVLEAKFVETLYEDYDVVTVRDLGLGESYVPVASLHSFEGTSSTGSRIFEFDYLIKADDKTFNDGVHVEIGLNTWDCKAHIWFCDLTSIHVFIDGISADGTMHPLATYNRNLKYDETYRVSVGVIIPIDGENAGKKLFIIKLNDEVLSSVICNADISNNYNIGIAGTEGVLKSTDNKKTVKFISQTGKTLETKEVRRGELVSTDLNPTYEGKVFLGWFDELGNLWNFESNKVLKDMSLFAKFGDRTIDAVILDENNIEVSHGYKVKIGLMVKDIPLPLVPSDALEFDGWYNGKTKLNPTDVITEDMDLICVFKVVEKEDPVDPVDPIDPLDPIDPVDPTEPSGCKSFANSSLYIIVSLLFISLIILKKKKQEKERI